MRRIINALLASLPAARDVMLLSFSFFFLFGVLGVSMFKGLFYSCNDSAAAGRWDCHGHFVNADGVLVPRVWANARSSFDYIGASILTLMEAASLKWVHTLWNIVDITAVDVQPVRNNSFALSWFLVVFIFAGSFFIVNLFVGVMVDQFQRNDGTALMTTQQKRFLELQRLLQQFE